MFSLYARARSLILPGTAGPDEAAILLGPDLPPCMQAAYSSAVFFRPPGTVSNAIDRPIFFIAQAKNPISGQVDEGWALWDQGTGSICGYYVTRTRLAALNPSGSGHSVPQDYIGPQAGHGSATPGGMTTQFGGAVFSLGPSAVSIGDGSTDPGSADFVLDGLSAPRGPRAFAVRDVSTGAVGVETNILATGTFDTYHGRMYKVEYHINSFGSAENTSIYRLYSNGVFKDAQEKENPAGTTLTDHHGWFYLANNSGAKITTIFTLSAAPNAGTITVSFGGTISRMVVEDYGGYQPALEPVLL